MVHNAQRWKKINYAPQNKSGEQNSRILRRPTFKPRHAKMKERARERRNKSDHESKQGSFESAGNGSPVRNSLSASHAVTTEPRRQRNNQERCQTEHEQ